MNTPQQRHITCLNCKDYSTATKALNEKITQFFFNLIGANIDRSLEKDRSKLKISMKFAKNKLKNGFPKLASNSTGRRR